MLWLPSTVINYTAQMGKWIDPHWNNLDLHKITKQKVYDTIFTDVDSKISPWTRKTILKMVRRIFEMAVENGIIDRNPCAGIRVNVPEVDQKVCNHSIRRVIDLRTLHIQEVWVDFGHEHSF